MSNQSAWREFPPLEAFGGLVVRWEPKPGELDVAVQRLADAIDAEVYAELYGQEVRKP